MDAVTGQKVRERAHNRCEYCRLPQEFSALQFHIEHIRARQHGGTDDLENLALACPECNYHKGTNLTSIDPDTGAVTPLFHPRIVGKTPVGRTTVWLFEIDSGDRLRLREFLLRLRRLE